MHCLRHRGPDEHGTWNDDHLVFGFNRLAIIDIAHSHQPLRWGPPENPERYALTFNGEIYNYLEIRAELVKDHDAKFFTEGDSEAIVAAFHYWGEDAVRRLRGMFAFAIWDTDTRELFIARDPFGIKPLFIATGAGGTAFGSEKKSLLELTDLIGIGTELDPRAIEHYTVLQYVPEPETLHKQIRRLESGSFARVRPGEEPTFTRYFTPKFPAAFCTWHREGALPGNRRGTRGFGRQAHARRRHRRFVLVRWYRLHGDRGAGDAPQPQPDHVHDRFRT
ncbi:asparagine synthetase B [Rhodococcus sp. 3Y1]